MDNLILKRYELLNDIKKAHEKIFYENKLLKAKYNRKIQCKARLFSGGYDIINMKQCGNKCLSDSIYCKNHSNELLYGNIELFNTEGWIDHTHPHESSIKKIDEYFKELNQLIN